LVRSTATPDQDKMQNFKIQGLLIGGEAAAVFHKEVLSALTPTDRAMFARAGRAYRNAVVDSGLPRAGADTRVQLEVSDFVGSVNLLSWARSNGMEWDLEV